MNELERIVNDSLTDSAPNDEFNLATVGAINLDGIQLIFDGTDEASEKSYKCNPSVSFEVGDRVKIVKESGSYIVEYPVNVPMARYPIPSGGTTGQVLQKASDDDYSLVWGDASGVPAGGTEGQVLMKNSGTDFDLKWGEIDINDLLPQQSASTYDKFLQSTRFGLAWADVTASNGLPTGGSAGQILRKTSSTNYACEWSSSPVNGTSTAIGFMGTTAQAKKTVNKLASSATLATTVTKVNGILTALSGYGLITSY